MAVTLSPVEPGQDMEPADDSAVAHVLGSPQFARAETQRKLLHYLWQRRHEQVSEYAIAVEALGRSNSFDPNTDASVRVHISRLRRKLKDFYAETGNPEMLVIPTGTHQLTLLEAPTAPAADPLPEPQVEKNWRTWLQAHLVHVLAGLSILLAVALAVTSVLLIRLNHFAVTHPPERANSFWNSYLAGDAPVKIVLPTPIFFNFQNHPWLKMRSTQVNAFDELRRDPEFKELTDKLGPVGLEQAYTVTWDTLAAIDIARYLDRIGQGKRVSFEVTRDSSLLSLEQANVIVLGTDNTLQPMHEYISTMNFVLTPGEEKVLNTHPEPGEQPEYDRVIQGRDWHVSATVRHLEPSIIALLPGRAAGLKVLMLESRDTSSMVSLLSSHAGSNAVDRMWRAHGSPKFFEMVTMTELDGNIPIRSWPVTLHAYTKAPPSNGL